MIGFKRCKFVLKVGCECKVLGFQKLANSIVSKHTHVGVDLTSLERLNPPKSLLAETAADL